jgi:hypothetical protein
MAEITAKKVIFKNRDGEYLVPYVADLDNTANTDLSNLTSTGQAKIDTKVSKSGDTMNGVLTIQSSTGKPLNLKSNNVDKTQAPASNLGIAISMLDKNNQMVGLLEQWNFTTGEKRMTMRALNSISGTEKTGQITVSVDANGNAFTSAPTPPTGDNSTKIATTAWVNNSKSTIASWSFPDWSKKESKILNTTYTANKNGFILFTSDCSGASVGNASLKINGVEVVYDYHGADSDDCHCYAPVAKNDTYNITCTHPVKYYYFVPCKGV